MLEDRLRNEFEQMGYQYMASNSPGIYLFYQVGEFELSLVSVIHSLNGTELNPQSYELILNRAKENFSRAFPQKLRLLSLVVTGNPDRAKHYFAEASEDCHWILDLSMGRLMVYENPYENFTPVKNMLERLLEEEEATRPKPKVMSPFTIVNTGIIIINIVVFILTNLTPLFGGEARAFYKGALNWHFVFEEKEYLRLLTAMFMHADFSHIFNNMLVMLFIGSLLERAVGKARYLFIYFGAGILAGLTSISYNMLKENGIYIFGHSVMAIGASGAIFGLVGAILYIVIINKGRLEQIGTRQIIIFVVLSLYNGVANAQIDQAAHIGGFVAGMILAMIVYRRRKPVPGSVTS